MSSIIGRKKHDIYPAIDPSHLDSGLAHSAAGRTIIVTGSGRGIGRSIALNYAKAGAEVLVLTSRTVEELTTVAQEISAINPHVKVIPQVCDVSNEESVKQLIEVSVQASNEYTGFTLINNAAYASAVESIEESTPENWWRNFEVNIKGVYLTTRFLLPHLKERKSKIHYIINVTSGGGVRRTGLGYSAYSCSKGAVNRFTDFLDVEHRESHNLRTFAVHPGGVDTKLSLVMPSNTRHLLTESPELMGGFSVWLGSGKVDWASGRYLECLWDAEDILKLEPKVTENGSQLLKIVVNV